jgi:hypothetical protein
MICIREIVSRSKIENITQNHILQNKSSVPLCIPL